MTVSITTIPTPKVVTPEAAAPARDQNGKFGQLIVSADTGNLMANQPDETPAAPANPPADQSLEALLSALKMTLAADTVLLPPRIKKANAGEKAPTTSNKPDQEGEDADPAAALLAALTAVSLPAPTMAKDLASQAQQAADDALGKPQKGIGPASLGDTAPATLPLPQSVDLTALADANAVKAPAAAAPATMQLERLIDTARDAAWLDRLSQDIAASAGAGDKMRFRMMPPHLGALDVSVERQAAGMSVSMTTHTTDARNLIADSRQQMVDSLKAQGVPLVQLSLSTAGEDLERHRPPPNFFNHLIEAVPLSGTDLAAQPVESTTAERVGRFA